MRSLWFMPFTFLAGQHGFLFFAPYLAFFLAGTHFLREYQRSTRPVPAPIPTARHGLPAREFMF